MRKIGANKIGNASNHLVQHLNTSNHLNIGTFSVYAFGYYLFYLIGMISYNLGVLYHWKNFIY
jgi:hypothetical protein